MRIYKTGYVLSLEEEKQMEYRQPTSNSKTLDDIKLSGAPYYRYIASSSDTCASCAALHGMAFHISDAMEATNLPPLHPNCKCDIAPYNFEDELPYSIPNLHDNPGGVTPNDWIFFGWDGDEFNSKPGEIYTDDYFGKAIPKGNYNQSELNMHIVDRIARILFHETSDAIGQEAIAWVMLNRMLKEGGQYTTNWNDDLTLFNIITASDQFEVFQSQHNTSSAQPSSYAPLEWITGLENKAEKEKQQESWANSLRLAKLLVSAACHPDLKDDEGSQKDKIRSAFESWVPNPFDCENPYDVWEYRSYLVNDTTWNQNIGGNIFYQK